MALFTGGAQSNNPISGTQIPGVLGPGLNYTFDFTSVNQVTQTINLDNAGIPYVATLYIDNSRNSGPVFFKVLENGYALQANPYQQGNFIFYAPYRVFTLTGSSPGHARVLISLFQAQLSPSTWDALHPTEAVAAQWTQTFATTSGTAGAWTLALAPNPSRDRIMISADASQTSGVLYYSFGGPGGTQALSQAPGAPPFQGTGPMSGASGIWVASNVSAFKYAIMSVEQSSTFVSFVQQFAASQTIPPPAGSTQVFAELYTSGGPNPASGGFGTGGGAYCNATIVHGGQSLVFAFTPTTSQGANTLKIGATTYLSATTGGDQTVGTGGVASIGTVKHNGGAGFGSTGFAGGGCGGPTGNGAPGSSGTGGAGGGGLAGAGGTQGVNGSDGVSGGGFRFGGGVCTASAPFGEPGAPGVLQLTWS